LALFETIDGMDAIVERTGADICSRQDLHSRHPWRSPYSQRVTNRVKRF